MSRRCLVDVSWPVSSDSWRVSSDVSWMSRQMSRQTSRQSRRPARRTPRSGSVARPVSRLVTVSWPARGPAVARTSRVPGPRRRVVGSPHGGARRGSRRRFVPHPWAISWPRRGPALGPLVGGPLPYPLRLVDRFVATCPKLVAPPVGAMYTPAAHAVARRCHGCGRRRSLPCAHPGADSAGPGSWRGRGAPVGNRAIVTTRARPWRSRGASRGGLVARLALRLVDFCAQIFVHAQNNAVVS